MRRTICGLLAIALSWTISGCQFKDIDKRSFVLAIGIDRPEDKEKRDQFEVTLKMAIPEGDPTQRSQESYVITEIADSVPEAIRLAKSKIDKELDFSHCKAMIYGDSLARDNIMPLVDWSSRRRDIQLIMYVAVGQPSAREVVKMQTKTERLPGNALILALGKEGTESPYIKPAYSFDLSRRTTEYGLDPIMPVVTARDPDMLIIDRVALFNKQKLITVLTPDETRMLNLLTANNLRSSFKVDAEGTSFDYNLENSKSKYRIKTGKEKQTVVEYHLSGVASLEDNMKATPVTGPVLRSISKAASEKWERDSLNLFKKIQASGVDPFGWGLRYYSRNWNNATEREEWERLYPGLEFQVKANLNVKYTGMIR